MDPQLSVLLYSKYSATSKKLMDLIQSSGVNFTSLLSLQLVCIDNDEIRNRILKNEQIDITSVPCILIIYPDGGIEKYDGASVFEWSEEIIRLHTPPQPPPPQSLPHPQKSEEQKWREQKAIERQITEKQNQEKEKQKEQIKEQNKKKYEDQQKRKAYEDEDDDENEDENTAEEPPRRKRIQSTERKKVGVTSISELPSDEDNDNADRYRRRKPVVRLRKNEGDYIEDDDLFQGDTPDMRKASRSAVKTTNSASQKKSTDIMSKAKEMAKGRESVQPPPGHPNNV
jgi:hypothetical protein